MQMAALWGISAKEVKDFRLRNPVKRDFSNENPPACVLQRLTREVRQCIIHYYDISIILGNAPTTDNCARAHGRRDRRALPHDARPL